MIQKILYNNGCKYCKDCFTCPYQDCIADRVTNKNLNQEKTIKGAKQMSKLYPYKYDNDNQCVWCKVGSCLICSHCTDVIWDYTNGPYMAFCELDLDMETCNHFELKE